MTCTTIPQSLAHLEARVAVLRHRYLGTLAEADAEAYLGDPVRHARLRAIGRRQYDAYWAAADAYDRARIEATYPECEE